MGKYDILTINVLNLGQHCSSASFIKLTSMITERKKSVFQDTMMMGADSYQTEFEIASLLAQGKVPIGVGHNTKIR